MSGRRHTCPECKAELELLMGDGGHQDDCWTCADCGIEYPHTEFPLPKGYVAAARKVEAAQELKRHLERELDLLAAWNAGISIKG